jgi:hypothetical protein
MVPELTPLIILGLATWRISSLLVHEAGPGDIFLRLREAIGITHDDQKHKVIIPDGFWGDLFSCVWCCSLWVAAGWAGFYLLSPQAALILAFVFALSALAILVQCVTER